MFAVFGNFSADASHMTDTKPIILRIQKTVVVFKYLLINSKMFCRMCVYA